VKVSQAIGAKTAGAPEYVFENAGRVRRHDTANFRESTTDGNTIRHIEQRDIGRGCSCLEIGGGGGSIASWLCARVGVAGRVLATDLDPQFLQSLATKTSKSVGTIFAPRAYRKRNLISHTPDWC